MNKPFENDNINVILERKPGSKVTLDIKISPKAADAAYHKAVKTINKQVSLPGFRKGKAPEAMIIKQYGSYVDREWKDLITHTAFHEAIQLVNVYPYSDRVSARPNLKKLSLDEGGELTVEYEATPEIPSVNPKDLKLKPVEKKEVSEEQIENAFEDIRFQHAEWQDITDRPVQEGDYVELTIENIETETPALLFQHTRFKVDNDNMGKWMRKLVIGKQAGDQVEGMSEKETDAKDFKPTKLRLTIHKIQTADLPEVNEEFAKKLGLDSVEAMRKKVAEELDRFAEEERQERMREQLAELLTEKYQVDLPSSMIQPEIEYRTKLVQKKIADKADAERAIKAAAQSVIDAYTIHFLLQKVASDQKLKADPQEIMHELMRQMFAVPPQERIIDPKGDPKESRARVHTYLVEQKAKDWLIEQAEKA